MNTCVLMAEIIKAPELRYTQDGQTAIAEMIVQFPALRAEDPLSTLKVTGWGNMAQRIQEQYKQGDQVIIEGRLRMSTIDRPEGFKEKIVELTASRIHYVTVNGVTTTGVPAPAAPAPAAPAVAPVAAAPAPVTPMAAATPAMAPVTPIQPTPQVPAAAPAPPMAAPAEEPNYDDIPF